MVPLPDNAILVNRDSKSVDLFLVKKSRLPVGNQLDFVVRS